MDDLANLSAAAAAWPWETGAGGKVYSIGDGQILDSFGDEATAAYLVSLSNAYRAGQLVPASELAELREKVARLEKPQWFYADGWEEHCFHDPSEVVDFIDPTESMVVEIATARPCPTMWVVVTVNPDEHADERWTLTEHATEAEARAALGGDQ